jgi:group I intron endonuclease
MKFTNSKQIDLYGEKVSCIYIVTNEVNGKVYIGQTVNFRNRLSDYQNIHHKDSNSQSIKKAIVLYGTDNFTIDILELCDPDDLDNREAHYIEEYQSTDRNFGYNYMKHTYHSNSEESRKAKSIGHMGLKASRATKMKKSNMILAVKDNTLISAYGAKFFGDYVGAGKDLVKNCLRQPCKLHGYRLYYDDFYKRQEIRKKVMNMKKRKDTEYLDVLDAIDMIEVEGLETMDLYFDKVFILVEDENSESGFRLDNYTIEEELEDYSVDEFDYPIMEESEEEPVDIFDYL